MAMRKLVTTVCMSAILAGSLILGGGMAIMRANALAESHPVEGDNPLPQENGPSGKAAAPAASPPVVTVSRPLQKDVGHLEIFAALLETLPPVRIKAPLIGPARATYRLASWIVALPSPIGAEVKKGDVLFETDPISFQKAVDDAKTGLATVQARLKPARMELKQARKQLAAGEITQADLDSISRATATAEKAELAAAHHLEWTQRNFKGTRIVAPVAGRLIALDGLAPDVQPGTGLATIAPTRVIGVRFEMDERSFLTFRRHQARRAQADELHRLEVELPVEGKGFDREATLDRFNDRFEPDRGAIAVHGTLPDPEGILLPGMFARVRIGLASRPQAFLVGDRAIFAQNGRQCVWVVNNQSALELREVTTGLRVVPSGPAKSQLYVEPLASRNGPEHGSKGGLRIVEKGLGPGDWVVTNPTSALAPGLRVETHRTGTLDH
jgi:RND family efflux transporter MFP subunit